MSRQKKYLDDVLNAAADPSRTSKNKIQITIIGNHGGIKLKLDSIKKELNQIRQDHPSDRKIILFNTGLHDVAQLCSMRYSGHRKTYLGNALTTKDTTSLGCVEMYRKTFREFLEVIGQYDAELKVFRTTTAGKRFAQTYVSS